MDGSLNHSEKQFQNNASGDTSGGGPGGPARPLILDQTADRRAEKFFFATPPPPPPNPRLSQGLDDRPGYATEDGFGEWSQWSVVSTQGGLFISSPFKAGGGLNRDGGVI